MDRGVPGTGQAERDVKSGLETREGEAGCDLLQWVRGGESAPGFPWGPL